MNLPIQQIDVWTRASHEDQVKAMILLSALPAREAENTKTDKAAYYIALEGVTRHGLSEAVRAILRGALQHPFFPSPPELRMQCDKAMQWHERQRERVWRHEQYLRERQENNVIVQRTPEAIARQQEAYRKFLEGYANEADKKLEAERAEIRARYGMTDEVLAGIKDQPLPANFKQVGKSAA